MSPSARLLSYLYALLWLCDCATFPRSPLFTDELNVVFERTIMLGQKLLNPSPPLNRMIVDLMKPKVLTKEQDARVKRHKVIHGADLTIRVNRDGTQNVTINPMPPSSPSTSTAQVSIAVDATPSFTPPPPLPTVADEPLDSAEERPPKPSHSTQALSEMLELLPQLTCS
ncbi:hypothetical protein F5878DRAFT_646415, partial [Lentinula raphanica]